MIVIAGPFIGEFGWELSYWQAWLRYLKRNRYQNNKFIVISYPGREQLYEFADKFISLPESFLNKNYSQKAYFLDYELKDISFLKKSLNELYETIFNEFRNEKFINISCFPQKIKTTNYYYRLGRYLNFFLKGNNKKNIIDHFNNYAGKKIKEPFHLNFPYYEKKYYPQYPLINQQLFIKLEHTKKAKNLVEKIISTYNKKHIFTLFPRKRMIRRSDKNWGEKNWEKFINKLIQKYDPLIFLCGTKNGSYFDNLENNENIFNTINFKFHSLLDFQIAMIHKSDISIHGLSGSAILSLLCNKKTFMYGNSKEYRTICIEGNPLNTKLYYHLDESLKPTTKIFFEKFNEFYKKK